MKTRIRNLLNFIVIFAFSSCIYYPQVTDIPLIKEKNDISVDAGVSFAPAAYTSISAGLTDKIAAQVSGSIGVESYYLQGALGRFKDLGNNNILEIYGGYGFGSGNAYNDANPGNLYGNYQLYFTQFNLGKRNYNHSNLDYGMGIKTGLYHSSLTNENYFELYFEQGPFNTNINNSFLLEPNVFIRFGGEHLKFNFKVGSCFVYQFTNRENIIPSWPVNVGLSLNYSINTKKKTE